MRTTSFFWVNCRLFGYPTLCQVRQCAQTSPCVRTVDPYCSSSRKQGFWGRRARKDNPIMSFIKMSPDFWVGHYAVASAVASLCFRWTVARSFHAVRRSCLSSADAKRVELDYMPSWWLLIMVKQSQALQNRVIASSSSSIPGLSWSLGLCVHLRVLSLNGLQMVTNNIYTDRSPWSWTWNPGSFSLFRDHRRLSWAGVRGWIKRRLTEISFRSWQKAVGWLRWWMSWAVIDTLRRTKGPVESTSN